MAAFMRRAFRLSSLQQQFSRVLWRKENMSRSLVLRCMSSTPNLSDPLGTHPQREGKAISDTPVNLRIKPSKQPAEDINIESSSEKKSNLSFATLFRQSKFTHLGNARGKVVSGTIFRTVGDDLYIDFGWKFHCVVKRPEKDAHLYVSQAVVRLRIIDLEMSTIFLGAEKETSLNEANCFLLGLISSPLRGREK